MKKILFSILILLPVFSFAQEVVTIKQGDVAKIDLSSDCIKSDIVIPKFGTYPVLIENKKKFILVPIDIRQATSTRVLPKCGKATSTLNIEIIPREKEVRDFVIPKDEGGNTKVNATKVKNQLANDAKIFTKLFSNKKQLWKSKFMLPVSGTHITDTYGYSRDSKGVTILHKGIDFKADIGTEVRTMNKGVVRYVGKLPTYGKTVIIDHGKGIQTVYLHLSKISVTEGTLIEKGNILGLSGNTGFTTGPHLHISIRVHGLSIDPETFMKVMGEK